MGGRTGDGDRAGGRTTRDVRAGTRSLLLRGILRGDATSRHELVAATGLSPAAVSKVTAELISDGLIVEVGTVPSDGGRPRILLHIAADADVAVGVDLGETSVQARLCDLSGRTRDSADESLPANTRDPATVAAAIARCVVAVHRQAPPGARFLGVGIGVPGIIEHTPEAVVHARASGWEGVPLEHLLRTQADLRPILRGASLVVENGATAMARAEQVHGAARGALDSVAVLVGTGVGTGIVVEGSPYAGVSSSAGEWGHTTIAAGGRRCRCGARGCLEAYVGGQAFRERLQERGADDGSSAGRPLVEAVTAALVRSRESPAVREVVAETVGYLGIGLANLINVLNPERIVLGGWFGLLLGGERLPEIWEATRRQALPEPFAQASIQLAELGPDAVAVGAATLLIDRFIDSGGM